MVMSVGDFLRYMEQKQTDYYGRSAAYQPGLAAVEAQNAAFLNLMGESGYVTTGANNPTAAPFPFAFMCGNFPPPTVTVK
jgi:hypothetical protein